MPRFSPLRPWGPRIRAVTGTEERGCEQSGVGLVRAASCPPCRGTALTAAPAASLRFRAQAAALQLYGAAEEASREGPKRKNHQRTGPFAAPLNRQTNQRSCALRESVGKDISIASFFSLSFLFAFPKLLKTWHCV